jgi:hypothetical protein
LRVLFLLTWMRHRPHMRSGCEQLCYISRPKTGIFAKPVPPVLCRGETTHCATLMWRQTVSEKLVGGGRPVTQLTFAW